jgi:hypothetical protein
LPGKALIDEQGRRKRDAEGKLLYVPVAQWRDRAISDRFSELMIAMINRDRLAQVLGMMGSSHDGEAH